MNINIALIGGMDRLERQYIDEAKKLGIVLKVYTKSLNEIEAKIKNVDAMVIFTNKVSHGVKGVVMTTAKSRGIPVLLQHSCGICTLRNCLRCLKKREEGKKSVEQAPFQPGKGKSLSAKGD